MRNAKWHFFNNTSPSSEIERMIWDGVNGTRHPTASLCLGGYIASLYDCKLRIPLWTAMSLPGDEVMGDTLGKDDRKQFKNNFPPSLAPQYEHSSDYEGSYKKYTIEKGHMIAARYAGYHVRGNETSLQRARNRLETSFSYYNAMPQYENTNTGVWRVYEGKLMEWAKCWIRNNSTRLYILVGAVPRVSYLLTTGIPQPNKTLFLSKGELYDNQSGGLGINVPQAMWTGTSAVPLIVVVVVV